MFKLPLGFTALCGSLPLAMTGKVEPLASDPHETIGHVPVTQHGLVGDSHCEIAAITNAPDDTGRFPLVVLSHGSPPELLPKHSHSMRCHAVRSLPLSNQRIIMQKRLLLLLTLSSGVLFFAGCAATVQPGSESRNNSVQQTSIRVPEESSKNIVLNVTGSSISTATSDWPRLQQEWHDAMGGAASDAKATFADESGKPDALGSTGTLVDVYINDFHFVSPGARYAFGIMTGNAFMDARVTFRDLRTGKTYGERYYNTSSSAWQGIFAAVTDKQTRAMAKQIVSQIDPR